jgi:V/A-type H+-transporting ATPase subunit I
VSLSSSERGRVDRLAAELRDELGVEVLVASRSLPSGDLAVLVAVPGVVRARVERALAGARIPEIPLPGAYASESLTDAAPKILDRLRAIPNELASLERTRKDLARESRDDLRRYRAAGYDRLAALAARDRSASTAHAFAVEGWLPLADVGALRRQIAAALGDSVILEELTREEWQSGAAPVVLSNPRLFRPFERLTALMPLPRYGSIDPTPFVAVGFPMLFGMILGDAGYGAVLILLALALRRGTPPASTRRNVSDIALACAAFAVIFGVLYGELFGALGQHWLGMRPLLLDREHAIVAAIAAAVAIGLAHTLLGMVLGIVTAARGEPRLAWSRAVQFLMMILVILALLAAFRVLPAQLFSPFALAVLVGFPILLVIEGIVAPIEFFSTLASVLSYVRIMALGTASVLLATVANEMVGLFGSVVVGALFALLFHLVNFALGLMSPTLHALRLHYVEFFRQFYSPGGRRYEPFGHWRTQHGSTPLTESEA